jgi:hypothetical protein
MKTFCFTLSLFALGCVEEDTDKSDPVEEEEEIGLRVLGSGTQDVSNVDFERIGDDDDGLNTPRDLAFNPDVEGELWVVNRTDDSVTIFNGAGTDDQDSEHLVDPFAMHFMDEVSSIAFGAAMHDGSDSLNFGTCQESKNDYNGQDPSGGNSFMGPSLWSSDRDIFAESFPEAVAYLSDLYGMYVDLGSHLDMLHESPLCMGIAHDYDNVYWVFDGYNESIYRYDFQEDHGAGYDDHGDGIMGRYVEGEVDYEADVPSHMVLDQESRLLYIADTGNNRIAILDTETGEEGRNLMKAEAPHTEHFEVDDAEIWTFIDGDDFGMEAPSGIALVDNVIFVTDNETSEIIAFSTDGVELDRLDTELDEGALMGIYATSLEELWIVDASDDRVYRIRPD